MKRRNALLATAALGVSALQPARAQTAARTFRVGLFLGGTDAATARQQAVIVERLAAHGLVEGRNLQVQVRIGSFDRRADAEVARALVATRPDAILVDTTPLAAQIRAATGTIPFVFTGVADPVEAGLVKTFQRPGTNATGVYFSQLEIGTKRLELLRELLPRGTTVWITETFTGPDSDVRARLRPVAERLSFRLIQVGAGWAEPFPPATWSSAYDRPDAIVSNQRWVVYGRERTADEIVRFAAEQRIPTMFWEAEMAERGATIAYGVDLAKELGRAADQIARVLKGAKPAELPVDQSTEFELVISRKSVRSLGITVPRSILERARVVE